MENAPVVAVSEPIDLRSDTVTAPTPQMRKAMAEAAVGDDVVGEDPTVNELESYSAALLGKEAALFVPTGTFANQCALLTFCRSGNEVLLAERCHIVQHEAGAAALISRAQLRPVSPGSPHILPEDIGPRMRMRGDIHYPETGLVCVEQATSDGTVVPAAVLAEVRRAASARGVPVYMDGARIFNAALALGVDVKDLAASADAVGFCLSKALCAPAGSLLAGTRDFIARARANRKLMGGGMRQAGVLAAPGLVALREMRHRLHEDHARARLMAGLLAEIRGVTVLRRPEINMVFASLAPGAPPAAELVARLASSGIKIYPDEGGVFRFVVHHYVTDDGVRTFVRELRAALS